VPAEPASDGRDAGTRRNDRLQLVVPTHLALIAVIELTFAPVAQIGGWNVRLETIALAIVLFAALVLAVAIGRRTPIDARRPPEDIDANGEVNHLRADDVLFTAVAALPGAVVGGRLGYALLHLDYYTSNPGAILDIGQGGFQLSLAVLGGTLTAAMVAGLLGGSLGRWLHAMILPLLLALAGGKAAMILGGAGQGVPWDGTWATAYLGPGPWGSLGPAIPSHPAQAYEALGTAALLVLLGAVLAGGAFRGRSGGAFLVGIALWAAMRAVVASTWRDPAVIGQLRMDQVLSLAIVVGSLLLLAVTALVARRAPPPAAESAPAKPDGALDWPDPTTRPRI
jgi:prolipoprotein diacylglyceryltransferase